MQGFTSDALVTMPLIVMSPPIEFALMSLILTSSFFAFAPGTMNTWYCLSSSGGMICFKSVARPVCY